MGESKGTPLKLLEKYQIGDSLLRNRPEAFSSNLGKVIVPIPLTKNAAIANLMG
jgi:hypothetical protein